MGVNLHYIMTCTIMYFMYSEVKSNEVEAYRTAHSYILSYVWNQFVSFFTFKYINVVFEKVLNNFSKIFSFVYAA